MHCFNLFLAALFFAGCVSGTGTAGSSSTQQPNSLPPSSNTGAAPQSDMQTLQVKIGETITLQFQDTPVTDYVWYYYVSEDWVISMTEPYEYPAKSANPVAQEQAPNTKTYLIKGLKKGTVSIRFYKILPWEPQSKPITEKFYEIKVS